MQKTQGEVMDWEGGSGPRYDQNPVLPSEAKSLPTHVENCAKRYVSLLQYLNVLSRRMRGLRIENWIYRAITLPILLWIAYELYRMRYGG